MTELLLILRGAESPLESQTRIELVRSLSEMQLGIFDNDEEKFLGSRVVQTMLYSKGAV